MDTATLTLSEIIGFMGGFVLVWGIFQAVDWGK